MPQTSSKQQQTSSKQQQSQQSPSSSGMAVLTRKHALTKKIKASLGVSKDSIFRYYYKSSNDVLKDFENWLLKACGKNAKSARQITQDCIHIWQVLDTEMRISPNSLADPELLEDYFVIPNVNRLKNESKTKKVHGKEKKKSIEAKTISSKLGALNKLLNFSKTRQVFFGLNFQQIEIITLKIQELNNGLKQLISERYFTLQIMITTCRA